MDLTDALDWLERRHHGVLVTLRRDGRAQTSDIVYALGSGSAGAASAERVVRISVTVDRAKTANMRRDPRVVLHVSEPSSWSYVSLDARADLSPVCTDPDDAVADELAAVYRAVAGGEHPDWGDFRRAMVAERRLVARLIPAAAVGQIHPPT